MFCEIEAAVEEFNKDADANIEVVNRLKTMLMQTAPSLDVIHECETFVHQSYFRLKNIQVSTTNGLVLAAKFKIIKAMVNMCKNMKKKLKNDIKMFNDFNWMIYLENNYFKKYVRFVEETEKEFLTHGARLNTREVGTKARQYLEHVNVIKNQFCKSQLYGSDLSFMVKIFVQRVAKIEKYCISLQNLERCLELLPAFEEYNKVFSDLEKVFKQNNQMAFKQSDYLIKRLEKMLEDYKFCNLPLLDNYHSTLVDKLNNIKSTSVSISSLKAAISGDTINLDDISPDKAFSITKNENQRQSILNRINSQTFNKGQYQTVKSFLVVVDSQQYLTIDKLIEIFSDMCSVLSAP